MIRNNQQKYDRFRLEYNVFVYERFDYVLSEEEIRIKFHFRLGEQIEFFPNLVLKIPYEKRRSLDRKVLDHLVFQLGMIELISYWKAACPPKVVIKPFKLLSDQIAFWKKLYFHGLGEFFYLNGIGADRESFMQLECTSEVSGVSYSNSQDDSLVLVPVGGGKDSVVTLELLKEEFHLIPIIVNPREASLASVRMAGFDEADIIQVFRTIDPMLLDLNEKGFLNGHTPFSAVLAFISLLTSAILGNKYIALSNESSANEPTIAGGPNHQYSKSYEFEGDFRSYVSKYLAGDIEYFSFLRPWSEYQIARVFSKFPVHFRTFKSCNVGSKEDRWCCNCPKCLFTAIILSPFISKDRMNDIFGEDLLDRMDLLPYFKELTGMSKVKPFECVGTIDEVNKALMVFSEKYPDNLPVLLKHYLSTAEYASNKDIDADALEPMENKHFLPKPFERIINSYHEKNT